MINERWFQGQEERTPPGAWKRESSTATAKMIYGLVSMLRPEVVLEIGTFVGDTTVWIARALVEAGKGQLITYDVNQYYLDTAMGNVRGALGEEGLARVEFRLEDLTRPGTTAPPAQFVFLDPDPKSLYLPIYRNLSLPSGAVLAAHDLCYLPEQMHVEALRRELDAGGWDTIGFPEERGLLVGRKW